MLEANHSGQLEKIFQQNIARDVDLLYFEIYSRGMTSIEIYDS